MQRQWLVYIATGALRRVGSSGSLSKPQVMYIHDSQRPKYNKKKLKRPSRLIECTHLAGVGKVGGSPLDVVVCQERIVHHGLVLTKLVEAEAHRRTVVSAVERSCERRDRQGRVSSKRGETKQSGLLYLRRRLGTYLICCSPTKKNHQDGTRKYHTNSSLT